MPRQQFSPDRVYQFVGEPGSGSMAVGYVRYYSEEQRTAFVQALNDAATRFRQPRVWWATADGLWDTNKVEQDDTSNCCILTDHHRPHYNALCKQVRR
jgi:hypothetical protein